MSYQAKSHMLVGFPYEDRSFIERAVEWRKDGDNSFKEEYEKQVRVTDLMPKYQADLEKLNQQALEVFYEYLEDRNIVKIKEHRGFDYIGFSITTTVSTDDNSLTQFCKTVKERSEELYELLGKKGVLLSAHDYS
ncbi:hypothetical protein [Psychrobacter sp. JB193]|uniref:hypothetical protein n=1 Tax=Psychrobacter sp. JB193 TaxID=2024406 RepID=UPI000BAB0C83|nr:hypothetical protein [Psychrobacter sp. JB193]PAT63100.1 hypothetical protein CIK80_11150 [Psychrobacter sp. JB193]